MSKICKQCKSEIDSKAKTCPNCRKKQGMPKWAIVLIVIFVIGIICATVGGDGESSNSKSSSNSSTKKEEKFSYTVDDTTKDTFSYYIEGTVKNNRDKDYSYLQIEFVCYDSEGNNLGTAVDNTNNLLAKQTWKYKAMFLGSGSQQIDHCDYHEITGW